MQLKTEISFDFQKRLKKRGYLCSTVGSLLLFVGANVLTIDTLEKVGLWIFLTAIVCIHLGLKPYREAKKRVFLPDEILVESDKLTHLHHSKIVLSIPMKNIKKISYRNKKYQYGLLIKIKKDNQSYFLPYFSKATYKKLTSHTALQNIMHFN